MTIDHCQIVLKELLFSYLILCYRIYVYNYWIERVEYMKMKRQLKKVKIYFEVTFFYLKCTLYIYV